MNQKKEMKLQSKLEVKKWLKRPLEVNCFKFLNLLRLNIILDMMIMLRKTTEVTEPKRKKNKDKWICDKCLIHLYRKDKWEYRENITNLARRRVLRTYIYDQKIA